MKNKHFKTTANSGFFDKEESIYLMSERGNPLANLVKVIDFEMFRPLLESKFINSTKKNNAGAKPFDYVMMFKVIILHRYFGLGDRQVQFQIIDRTSFKEFLGLSTGDKVPDEKTVWAFREKLTNLGVIEELFTEFISYLHGKGLILNDGKIIDASFTISPRQRNTREENEMIKEGRGDELWNNHPHKNRHKDIDARWTKKRNETFYGFKNHVKMDEKSKFVKT